MSATAMSATIERYFQISLFLLVAAGFATLATTGKLELPGLLLAISGLALRGWQLIAGSEFNIPDRWTSWITLLYVVFYAADYFWFSAGSATPFVNATVHLVLFAMVVKLFSAHRDRDYLYLAVLSFLEVLAASVLTVDTVFLGALIVFLLLTVNTFVAFEMRRSLRQADVCAADSVFPRRLSRSLLFSTLALVGGILLLGGMLFFALPRATAGYFGAFTPVNEVVSGFSNEVNLGRIGEIKQLNTVVMYVQILGGRRAGEEVKWRGLSLGLFDGQRWSNPSQDMQPLMRRFGQFDLTSWYQDSNDIIVPPHARSAGHILHYRVLMEPIGSTVFFLAPKPENLMGPYRVIGIDPGGAVHNYDRERMISSYDAISVLQLPATNELRRAGTEYPPGIQLRYLQLPQRFDPRVRTLAKQITANTANAFDKARALESYLRANYGYSLQLPATRTRDPVASFLFERKQGHCELFASAMTLMLRELGIPARLVNGFQTGEFNDLTGSYVVRARDAHTWVEAYFPAYGWITFDPTPADPNAIAGGTWHRFLLYLDAGREFWRDWIVNYDFAHQRSLTMSAVVRGRVSTDRFRHLLTRSYLALLARASRSYEQVRQAPLRWTGVFAILAACLVSAFYFRRGWRAFLAFRAARHPERAPQSSATLWYLRLLKYLARRGWQKKPSQTAEGFLASINDPGVRMVVTRFTLHYHRARFAGSAVDARQLPELFAEIQSKI